MSSALNVDQALHEQYIELGSPPVEELDWTHYDLLIRSMHQSVTSWPTQNRYYYHHPVTVQNDAYSVGKPYSVPIAYSDPGGNGEPVIAIGGLINVTQRFDFLAMDATPEIRVIGLDLAGRGGSGWMIEISDYNIEAYIEQLRQFLDFMSFDCCSLLGSSLGGSTAIHFAARYPQRVNRIILNDSTPYIPYERRARRAAAVARHYVFSNPSQLFRRTGAATKHKGPTTDAASLHYAHNMTCWSDNEEGRIYRHDLRALLAYRNEATESLNIWPQWDKVECPVLLLHGTQSDATSVKTIDQMRQHKNLSVIHVHKTGHTPSLSDGKLNDQIAKWILDDRPFNEDMEFEPVISSKNYLYKNG